MKRRNNKKEIKKYDVFISHATKDKVDYVDKLAEAISSIGINVFYDDDCIAWGDKIQERIEEALDSCKLAVVVISENYFGRQWTEHELRTLLQRQSVEQRKIIMPILHNVSKTQLIEHYPELSNIKFKYSKSCTCEDMAQLLKMELEKR